MNSISNYISDKIRNIAGSYINPSTEEKQDDIVSAINNISITDIPLIQGENGELFTRDISLEEVFGSNKIVKDGNLKSVVINDSNIVNEKLFGLGMERSVKILDYSTCAIQLSGVWAGTIVFEANSNGGDFVSLAGINITTNSLVTSVTGNGIFKFNVSGLQRIRVRCSAFTSGVTLVNFTMSSGEQQQPLSQRATTFELNTFDTNLASLPTAIGTTQMYQTGFELEAIRKFAPTIAPTQPTTYIDNKFAQYPQNFRRLRVESGGSERQPFAQEPHTNIQIVKNPEERQLLESILIELKNIRSSILNDGSPIVE